MKKSIFKRRVAFKPYEYPEVFDFIDALQSAYWVHKEYNYTKDIQDFTSEMSEHEREVVKRCMLAISQIEVSVKTFWGKLYEFFPKSEFNSLGVQLAFNELIHERAYSEVLSLLGLEEDFKGLLNVPEIKGRIDYMEKYMKRQSDNDKQNIALNIALFSAFIENVSLFSQFFIMKSYNYSKNYFSGVDNIISATMLEEDLHHKVGIYIIEKIKEEYPGWFKEEFKETLKKACKKAYNAEKKIVEWIFDGQDLEWLSVEQVDNFLRDRFNRSMVALGAEPIFEINDKEKEKYRWFDAELMGDRHTDFFNKRPTTYSRNISSITENDLF